jgi:hypothetical protein
MPEAPSIQDAKREITRAFQDTFGYGAPPSEVDAKKQAVPGARALRRPPIDFSG